MQENIDFLKGFKVLSRKQFIYAFKIQKRERVSEWRHKNFTTLVG